MAIQHFDKIIIGAGLYGLYSALLCGKNGQHVAVLEYDSAPFERATYINQARVHMGYHYPRSLSTAMKSAGYFERFCHDYSDCILTKFDQVYATSTNFSWTDAKQFVSFCNNAGIKCEEIAPSKYFLNNQCDGAFLTEEYTYDALRLRDKLMSELEDLPSVELYFNTRIQKVEHTDCNYLLAVNDNRFFEAPFVLNASYASVNQINSLFGYPPFAIKYELCEIILCSVNEALKNVGITVMDGPFFSIMPFGLTGFHSLTSVTFTPHLTSKEELPVLSCQKHCAEGYCSPSQLGNCNFCGAKPETAWGYMSRLAHKYMNSSFQFTYEKSLFSMKPILRASEVDDSRPTVIRQYSEAPTFVSVLSGKINTVYDLDEVLLNG